MLEKEYIEVLRDLQVSTFARESDRSALPLVVVITHSPPSIHSPLTSRSAPAQDNVPGFGGDRAIAIVEAEFGMKIDDLFDSFEKEPIAAASLGQVRRAPPSTAQYAPFATRRPSLTAHLSPLPTASVPQGAPRRVQGQARCRQGAARRPQGTLRHRSKEPQGPRQAFG